MHSNHSTKRKLSGGDRPDEKKQVHQHKQQHDGTPISSDEAIRRETEKSAGENRLKKLEVAAEKEVIGLENKRKAPSYGSRDYWEQRYRKNVYDILSKNHLLQCTDDSAQKVAGSALSNDSKVESSNSDENNARQSHDDSISRNETNNQSPSSNKMQNGNTIGNVSGNNNQQQPKGEKLENSTLEKDSPLPFHAWYFTYEELRPILLPLILGGRQEARDIIERNILHDDEDEGENDDVGDDGDDDDNDEDNQQSEHENDLRNDDVPDDEIADDSKEPDNTDKEVPGAKQTKACGNKNAQETGTSEPDDEDNADDLDDDGFEEVEDDDENDDEEDEVERLGLAASGPIAILEIGCGDVPLGCGLAKELLDLEGSTAGRSESVVKQIVCTDYSDVVIDMLKKQYVNKRNSRDDGEKYIEKHDAIPDGISLPLTTDIGNVPLEFASLDARNMPYPDGSFELVLEKGVLDAMLSDKKEGVSNCISIVAECARVLRTGGYMMIVSHLNAHTTRGVGWLEEVVFGGLDQGGKQCTWLIEVHGKEETDDEESVDSASVQSVSPGPAVYIINKKPLDPKKTDTKEGSDVTIPVKFYAY